MRESPQEAALRYAKDRYVVGDLTAEELEVAIVEALELSSLRPAGIGTQRGPA